MPRKQSKRVCPIHNSKGHTPPISTEKTKQKRTAVVAPIPMKNSFSVIGDSDSDSDSDDKTQENNTNDVSVQKSSRKYAPWVDIRAVSYNGPRRWVDIMEEEDAV